MLAGDIAGAEQVVLRHRYALMNSERWHILERWLRYFPDSALDRSALLATTVTIVAQHGRNLQVLKPTLQKAEQLLADLTPNSATKDHLLGELSVMKSILAVAAGNVEAATTNARRGLQLLPAEALDLRAIAWGTLAASMQMSGQSSTGYQLLREKISEPEWGESIQAKLMSYLCMNCVLQGDLTMALDWAGRVQNIGERLNLPESLCQARYFMGVIHFLRGESDAAEPHLFALVENEVTSSPTFLVMGAMALALIRHERGDERHADAILDRLTAYFREGGDSAALALLKAFRVELALRRGNLDAARRQQVGVEFEGRSPVWFFYYPQLTRVKLLLAEGTPEALAAAHATLDDFEQQMRLVNRNLARIEALALLALVCDAQSDAARADASLTTALVLAKQAGIIRPFVDLGPPMASLLVRLQRQKRTSPAPDSSYVARILAAFPPPGTAGPRVVEPLPDAAKSVPVPQPMLEPLTQRESQILELLATELSPDEIGRRLYISTSTVRTHSRNVYAKLDVHTRFEAVHRARELGLR
ncbi:MAG: LuxR C-terminal-related transcriptional regulator [Caldilineales bacterium]